MLVQLRRVVYLLVLLQCCACVTYAASIKTAGSPGNSFTELQIDVLMPKVEILIDGAQVFLNHTKNLTKECTLAADVVSGVVDKVNDFVKEVEDYMDNVTGDFSAAVKYVHAKKSEAEEITEQLMNASVHAKAAAVKARETAYTSIAKSIELDDVADTLLKLTHEYIESLLHHNRPFGNLQITKDRGDKSIVLSGTAKKFVMRLENGATSVTQEADRAEEMVEEASRAEKQLEETIEKLEADIDFNDYGRRIGI
ncbi:hypothetical protein LSM04_002799 [Trypanosoma melophagium]|uniref:uncharacterized protein n=1 Tax=Trypanosoma melophagium TaxID=715481 RepID=UPI003519DB15|nr:hypothetical protein LSM04_002799 [Trypanosoma melophagium]